MVGYDVDRHLGALGDQRNENGTGCAMLVMCADGSNLALLHWITRLADHIREIGGNVLMRHVTTISSIQPAPSCLLRQYHRALMMMMLPPAGYVPVVPMGHGPWAFLFE